MAVNVGAIQLIDNGMPSNSLLLQRSSLITTTNFITEVFPGDFSGIRDQSAGVSPGPGVPVIYIGT